MLLCASDGGAAPDACAGLDLSEPAPIALPDGGVVAGFRRLADGGIGGAWPEPDDRARPGLAACPAGWRREDDGACDPLLRHDCPPGSASLPGGRCTPTSAADCPASEYAEVPAGVDPSRVIYVAAAGGAGAPDGSRAAPYSTLGAALDRVAEGGVVLVARGVYRERLRVTRSARVIGACAAGVTIDGADLASAGPVVVNVLGEGVDFSLRGVTLRGAAAGLRAHFGAHVRVEGAVVAGCQAIGLYAYEPGSTLEVTSSVVRDVREREPRLGGVGLVAFDRAVVRATDVVVEGATGFALHAESGASLAVASSVVRDTARGAGGDSFGAVVDEGASFSAVATVFTGHRSVGIAARGVGAVASLTDSVVGDGEPTAAAIAVQVHDGATLRATGLRVDGAQGTGVLVVGEGTSATFDGSLVRRTAPSTTGGGQGLIADDGASLRATATILSENTGQSALARGAGTSLSLEGSIVRDTAAAPRRHNGAGLLALEGAALRARGVVVERSVSFGVIAHGAGTSVDLAGVAIRDTRRDAWGYEGRGVLATFGASLDATGTLVSDSFEDGVAATAEGTRLTARDLMVLDVRASDAGLGRGVLVDGARVDLARVAVWGCVGAGLLVSGSERGGTQTEIRDLLVRDVRPGTVRFVLDGARRIPFGAIVSLGLHANFGGEATVTGALIDVGGLGLFNAGGTLRLSDAVVSRQREGMGAFAAGTPESATTLVRVRSVDNVDGSLRRRDDLPAAASLGAPVDPCADGCL